ncbi:MAG TPA: hypothetical protein VFZ66_22465 [Herpetosiphonaceae bacterium]
MMPTTMLRSALAGFLVAMLFGGCTAANPPVPKAAVTSPTTSAVSADSVSPGQQPLNVIPVSGKPYRTLALKPTTGYSGVVVADDGRIYLSCGVQKQSEATGVCMIDPATGSETFLVDPRADNARLGSVAGNGAWAVYSRLDTPQRVMAINTVTKEKVQAGTISAGTTGNPVGLAFAISGSQIVWVDEAETADKRRVETVMLFDLEARTNRALTTLEPAFVVDQIDFDGATIVWSQVDTSDMANVTSNVYAYDLASDKLQALSTNGRASMPQVHDRYVVWKTTATRFAYGSVYLHDLTTGSGKEVAKADPNASPVPLGYDMPSIGGKGVTWISSRNERIELYHPDTGRVEALDQGGGRAFTAGHYLIWVNDSVAQKGDWHLLWSDLSAPARAATVPSGAGGWYNQRHAQIRF